MAQVDDYVELPEPGYAHAFPRWEDASSTGPETGGSVNQSIGWTDFFANWYARAWSSNETFWEHGSISDLIEIVVWFIFTVILFIFMKYLYHVFHLWSKNRDVLRKRRAKPGNRGRT